MPVYNGERFVEAAIRSVLGQTVADLELIVIDDGSTDGTPAILADAAASDDRVVIRRQPNSGRSAARNAGLEIARAPLVALLDADDIALPGRLHRQREFLAANPAVAVVGGAIQLIDENGRVLHRVGYPTSDREIRDDFRHANPIAHSTAMVRKVVFDRVGSYRPAFVTAQDLDLWLRVAEHFQFANLRDVVCQYRVHPLQTTVLELENQAFGTLAAHAAARARASRGSDPLDSAERIGEQDLFDLGVTRADITDEFVRRACSVANMMDLAGHPDLAKHLAEIAAKRARSESGSSHLVAVVHREYADQLAHKHHRVRASLRLGRALVADRARVNPALAVGRLLRRRLRRA
jgi:hypothetical protein